MTRDQIRASGIAVPPEPLPNWHNGYVAFVVGVQPCLLALHLGQVEKENIGALAPGTNIALERPCLI